MKTIKEVISELASNKRYYFPIKNEYELRRILHILKSVGFTWADGRNLYEKEIFNDVLLRYGTLDIRSNCKVGYGTSDSCENHGYNRKDFFEFIKENGILIKKEAWFFNIDSVNCLTLIRDINGFDCRVLSTDLKSRNNIVLAIMYQNGEEKILRTDNIGNTYFSNNSIHIETETLVQNTIEMTVDEIEKALCVTNLKIVK